MAGRHIEHVPLTPLDDLLDRPRTAPWLSPSRLLFESPLLRIGAFRADPTHPKFHDSGPITELTFAFPRTSVRIEHEGRRPFVADARIVTYYNPGQVYRRSAVDPAGDLAEWFSLRQDVVLSVLGELDPAAADRPDRAFDRPWGPGDPRSYVQQRALVRYIRGAGDALDVLAVEETTIRLFRRVVERAHAVGSPAPLQPAHRELADRLRGILAVTFHEQRSLSDLSRELGCSPFYLARVFRAVTGTSIHQHRLGLRLARSLERVASGQALRAVAFDVGFSSPSHFAAAFRGAFGITPSRFRQKATLRLVRELTSCANGTFGEGPRIDVETPGGGSEVCEDS